MANVNRKSRPRSVLIMLILASVTILSLGYGGPGGSSNIGGLRPTARGLIAPVDSAVRSLAAPVVNFVKGAESYQALKRQNERLAEEVSRLRVTAAGAIATERQLAQLAKLEHLTFAQNLGHIPAEVVSSSSSNFELTVRLDKGSSAGIRTGMPVVSGGGLVGRVVSVSKTRSIVRLITDYDSAVGVRIGSTTAVSGVASGMGAASPLRVDYISTNTPVPKGAQAVTTQVTGGIYPPGIPVGFVVSTGAPAGALQQRVSLRPYVDFANLAFVNVLRWTPGGG